MAEGCWANAGQVCIKTQRVFVQRSLFADFVDRFVNYSERVVCGDPLREDTMVGPLIEAKHVTRVLDWCVKPKKAARACCSADRSAAARARAAGLFRRTEKFQSAHLVTGAAAMLDPISSV